MRDNVKNIARIVGETLRIPGPVVEIGSYQVAGQEEYADIRPFFAGREFIGCDMRPGPGVDRVENVEKMTFEDGVIGTLLMLDTLEHVANCQRAMQEAYRVLQPGGFVVIVSVMDFAVHLHPSDYWRFTPQAFDLLLEAFPSRWVFLEGNPFCPHTVIGYGLKGDASDKKPEGLEEALSRTRAAATSLGDVDYDDPRLLSAYPYHTAHDGYPMFAALRDELSATKSDLEKARSELEAVERSRGWRTVRRIRQAKDAAFPPQTMRSDIYQAIRRNLK